MAKSLAFSNADFGAYIPYAPCPPLAYSDSAGSNVVRVDFVRKRPALKPATDPSIKPAEWRDVAAARLGRLHRLEVGWDGPGSVKISELALTKAGRLLDVAFGNIAHPAPPAAVPCGDGSLQLEWWLTDTRLDVVIEADGSIECWAKDRPSGIETEAEGAAGSELLIKWAARLTADKLLPAS